MQAIHRTLTRCHVCGFSEVRTDEAFDRELVILSECPRCNHRWTSSDPATLAPARVRALPRVHREIATAA